MSANVTVYGTIEVENLAGEYDELEYEADASISPGDKGCWTQRNGDPGWPATGPEVEITEIRLLNGYLPGAVYDYHAWLAIVGRAAMEDLEDRALEVAADRAESAAADEADRRWEERHERREE